ncbi:MAG: hypothetical protein Q4D73_06260 [Actinomycetaceae bacterium]|nr:hypothetical protein [Actinomycetaceae bacterium]
MRSIFRNAKFLMLASALTMLAGLIAFATTSYSAQSAATSPAYFVIIAFPSAVLFFLISLPLSLWGDKRRKTTLAALAEQALLAGQATATSPATQEQLPAEAALPEVGASPAANVQIESPYKTAQSYAGAFIFLVLALVASLTYLVLQTIGVQGEYAAYVLPWILGAVIPFGVAALFSLVAAFYTQWRYGNK